MEPNQIPNQTQSQVSSKTSAKDFFINLGAIVALGFFVGNLINLLFTIINKAFPLTTGFNFSESSSISFPVAVLIIVFPIYIFLMWLLEKGYVLEPEKRNVGVRKWLTYITLFISGFALAGDLVTVLYYFIDGQDITTGFILKALSVLVISLSIFFYYIYDVLGKNDNKSRKIWMIASAIVIILCIIWGFTVLGSPRTQQLLKYDQQKVNDLLSIENSVQNFYATKGVLPNDFDQLLAESYFVNTIDSQTQKLYEYQKTGNLTYNLCAEFNKDSKDNGNVSFDTFGNLSWAHPVGYYCFSKTINPNLFSKPIPVPIR
ncbi:MAG: DUF5671 domain-containing protein [Candidatus Paceibacterota bacterium]